MVTSPTDHIPYACIENARVQAFVAPIVQHPVGYRGGPVLENPEHQVFRHHRGGMIVDNFSIDAAFETYLPGDFTYAGAMYDHFGHFMAEMVHRVLAARLRGLPERYLFVTAAGNEAHASFQGLPVHLKEVLSFLGLTADNVVIVRENVVVEHLHLVPQAAQHHGDPPSWYLSALRDFSAARLDAIVPDRARPRRIYVSRAKRPLAGGLLGEGYLEEVLSSAGFQPFYPEEHAFAEQMDHYRKADCVVFTQGSACHGTELLGTGMLRNVVLIPKSVKAGFFERMLRPRSERFMVAGVPNQVGTMHYDPASKFQYIHLGVSLVNLTALEQGLRAVGVELPRISRRRYRRAAFRDLRRYIAESSRGQRLDKKQAARLVLSFFRKI